MHLHFLGICGTFMGSLALLAREMGYEVSGCDLNVYPPMSTQLEQQGIHIHQGYDVEQFNQKPDLVIIGNAMSRGNEAVEYVLNEQLPYCSGPQWLSQHLLHKKWVLAVSGTHGKTTTTAMLAWILECAGKAPGFLIGGVPGNFECSARLGNSDYFVIEADEYDTAFFDKRSKFLHYHPKTLVINNLEFDHADIFDDISAIQKQFQHLLRIVPSSGLVIYPHNNAYIEQVLAKGLWSSAAAVSLEKNEQVQWYLHKIRDDGSHFEIHHRETGNSATVNWTLMGEHNLHNALSACVAAHHVGVPLEISCKALESFKNSRRRMEKLIELVLDNHNTLTIYDDFAHHPTAIETSIRGLKNRFPNDLIFAVLEPRSNTMKMGVHGNSLAKACEQADLALWYVGDNLALADSVRSQNSYGFQNLAELQNRLEKQVQQSKKNVHVVFMSNGSFAGAPRNFIERIQQGIKQR